MVRIIQTATAWELWDGDTLVASGSTNPTEQVGPGTVGWRCALAAAGARMRGLVAAAVDAGTGLLEDTWTSESGIAFTAATGPYRTFENCEWSWRDPTANLVPLMFVTENQGAHFGATLAGYVDRFWQTDGTVYASGGFFDIEAGHTLHDLMLDGRTFPVSVDPSENVDVDFRCTEWDEDMGYCMSYVDDFLAYEIAGLTGVPFPGFEAASIQLASATADTAEGSDTEPDEAAAPINASAAEIETQAPLARVLVAPVAPPAEWFTDPALDDIVPMTVTDDGRVFGHLAAWGVCHIGYENECVTAPVSPSDYAYYRTGEVACDDGTRAPTGVLTMGIGHAPLHATTVAAVAHYDNTAYGVADLASGEDAYGIWIAGAIRPDLDDARLRTLRASSPSGDWRGIHRHLELIAALCVNVPGFPIPRSQARVAGGKCVALIAAGPKVQRQHPDRLEARVVALETELAGLRAAGHGEGSAPPARSRHQVVARRKAHPVSGSRVPV